VRNLQIKESAVDTERHRSHDHAPFHPGSFVLSTLFIAPLLAHQRESCPGGAGRGSCRLGFFLSWWLRDLSIRLVSSPSSPPCMRFLLKYALFFEAKVNCPPGFSPPEPFFPCFLFLALPLPASPGFETIYCISSCFLMFFYCLPCPPGQRHFYPSTDTPVSLSSGFNCPLPWSPLNNAIWPIPISVGSPEPVPPGPGPVRTSTPFVLTVRVLREWPGLMVSDVAGPAILPC